VQATKDFIGPPTSVRQQLIDIVFPDGIPADSQKLSALALWLIATDAFLAQI